MPVMTAIYDGKYIVPDRPLTLRQGTRLRVAFIVPLAEEHAPWRLSSQEREVLAAAEFRETFPDVEPDPDLMRLVGVLPPLDDVDAAIDQALWEVYGDDESAL